MSSTLKVDILQDSGGNNLVTSNGSGVITAAGFGKIGQVVQTTKSSFFTSTSTSYTDVTDMSVTITPSSTSSKILIVVNGNAGQATNGIGAGVRILRDSTEVTVIGSPYSQSGGSIYVPMNINFLDSPSTTSATTYKLQSKQQTTGSTFYFNTHYNTITGETATITAMEVLP